MEGTYTTHVRCAATVLWVAGVIVVSFLPFAVPALRRRTLELRIVDDASSAGGGRRGSAPVTSDPESGATMNAGPEPTTAREG